MIWTTFEFIDKFFIQHPRFKGKKVLDVGSLDVSGNPREAFEKRGFTYIGSDISEGPNVDVVINGHALHEKFKAGEFDLVFCVDTLEHDEAFWITIKQIYRLLRRNGYLILGMPGRAHYLHRHPYDYWRFMPDSFEKVLLAKYRNIFVEVKYHETNHLNQNIENEIYGWGRKK